MTIDVNALDHACLKARSAIDLEFLAKFAPFGIPFFLLDRLELLGVLTAILKENANLKEAIKANEKKAEDVVTKEKA